MYVSVQVKLGLNRFRVSITARRRKTKTWENLCIFALSDNYSYSQKSKLSCII